jgi:hypothetical protein
MAADTTRVDRIYKMKGMNLVLKMKSAARRADDGEARGGASSAG